MIKPIRCFDGNAKPDEPFWRVSARGEAEINFDGPISEYVLLDDETAVRMADAFKNDLYAAGKGGPVTVRVNSPGGDIFAASKLRAIMLDYPGEITTRVDSVCASAATFLLTAGKRTLMMDTASLLIHDPSLFVLWADIDIETGQTIVDALKAFKDNVLAAYESRTGLSRERLSKMMSKTTYMSARDAVAYGFADEILVGQQAAPRLGNNFINTLKYYGSVPSYVLSLAETESRNEFADAARRLQDYIQVYKGV